MRISARNSFKGRISDIKRGAVMAQVTVDIGGGNRVLSAIFVDSVEDLGLTVGDEVIAIVKSTDVIIARP
ncbi:MAG TPA: TOBE domain-containing protein [Alphaproteobacteria bacterium]|nr:TOBE domain-containing protein [Alphaproteobacteria bacterium]